MDLVSSSSKFLEDTPFLGDTTSLFHLDVRAERPAWLGLLAESARLLLLYLISITCLSGFYRVTLQKCLRHQFPLQAQRWFCSSLLQKMLALQKIVITPPVGLRDRSRICKKKTHFRLAAIVGFRALISFFDNRGNSSFRRTAYCRP